MLNPTIMNHYLAVDGGYFEKVAENYLLSYFPEKPKIKYGELLRGYLKGFYYSCLPDSEPAATKAQERFTNIRRVDGFHVITGELKGRGKRIRQKGVDVSLAVDLLTHAYNKNMNEVTIIAGDLDFYPLVDALIRQGVYVRLLCESRSASADLIQMADSHRELDPWIFSNYLDMSEPWSRSQVDNPLFDETAEIHILKKSKGYAKAIYVPKGEYIQAWLQKIDIPNQYIVFKHRSRTCLDKLVNDYYGEIQSS